MEGFECYRVCHKDDVVFSLNCKSTVKDFGFVSACKNKNATELCKHRVAPNANCVVKIYVKEGTVIFMPYDDKNGRQYESECEVIVPLIFIEKVECL